MTDASEGVGASATGLMLRTRCLVTNSPTRSAVARPCRGGVGHDNTHSPRRHRMDLRHTVTTHWTEQTSADHFDYLEEQQ